MSKIKRYDGLPRVTKIPEGGTDGAILGVNLRDSTGRIIQPSEVLNTTTDDGSRPTASTIWRLIREIPANIVKVAALAGVGFTTRGSDGNWYQRTLQPGTGIDIQNGDGVADNPSIGLADLANTNVGTALVKITRDSKGRVAGTSTATTNDLPEGSANLYYTDSRADARANAAVAAHVAQTDPHPQYTTTAEAAAAAPVQSVNGKTGNVTLVTDDIAESGTPTNLWHTAARVRAIALTGLSTAVSTAISATDSILVALGKAQAQLDNKEPAIAAGATTQFWRGDKKWSSELLGDMTLRSASINCIFRKAAVTASVSGESLMGLNAYGANGTAEVLGGTLNFRPGQNWTGTTNGCDFAVRVNNYGTATLTERFRVRGDGAIVGGSDNAQTCGSASLRWSTVYAGTGTINTSDAREKTPVAPLSAAELACAIQLGREIGWFQFHEAVAAKGEAARQHVGMTVQRAIEVMQQHGLDPFRWGFICHDAWGAQDRIKDEDGTVIQEARAAGDRYSFREGELHAFILRGFMQRQDQIEARISAVEAQ